MHFRSVYVLFQNSYAAPRGNCSPERQPNGLKQGQPRILFLDTAASWLHRNFRSPFWTTSKFEYSPLRCNDVEFSANTVLTSILPLSLAARLHAGIYFTLVCKNLEPLSLIKRYFSPFIYIYILFVFISFCYDSLDFSTRSST